MSQLTRVMTAPFVVAYACVCETGCGRSDMDAKVTGTVLIDGELANSGTVTFQPVGGGAPASGRIFKNGSYSIRVGQGDLSNPDGGALPAGEYVVTVSIYAPSDETLGEGGPPLYGPSLIDSKYADPKTSDLKFTVTPGPNLIELKLDSAEPTVDVIPDFNESEGTSEIEGGDESNEPAAPSTNVEAESSKANVVEEPNSAASTEQEQP